MPDKAKLIALLDRIDGRSYPSYRDIKGRWQIEDITLIIDHVQGDPFAAPSRVRIQVPTELPATLCQDRDQRDAAEDWLLRAFLDGLHSTSRGSGKSGQIRVYRPGPEVTERSALRLSRGGIAEVRFTVGLPARGRRVLGRQAAALLLQDVPNAATSLRGTLGLAEHIQSVQTQRALRRQLEQRGLIAFVANNSLLPRASGIDQRVLAGAIPFQSPTSLEVELESPQGPVRGLGIPRGITLIVGGGFHGKSTLLHAIQRGHLDHIPGDGRNKVVTKPSAVKVRAEDGRRVTDVDISPFLRDLPGGKSTSPFRTDDASGSTSQAAAIIEAVEAGASILLIDEDTSATNLLVRDERMRALIPRDKEPITPFVERVRALYSEWGVSTVMVVGGVGDYLAVADTVIAMDNYQPKDVTERAKSLAGPAPECGLGLPRIAPRIPLKRGLEPDKIRTRDQRRLGYGGGEIDLSAIEQILDAAHAVTIGEALRLIHGELLDGKRNLQKTLDMLETLLDAEGVELLAPRAYPPGDLVRPRRFEVAAALSRVRTLAVHEADQTSQKPVTG